VERIRTSPRLGCQVALDLPRVRVRPGVRPGLPGTGRVPDSALEGRGSVTAVSRAGLAVVDRAQVSQVRIRIQSGGLLRPGGAAPAIVRGPGRPVDPSGSPCPRAGWRYWPSRWPQRAAGTAVPGQRSTRPAVGMSPPAEAGASPHAVPAGVAVGLARPGSADPSLLGGRTAVTCYAVQMGL
jgi:hypothetical protein